jgi:bifunctional DNA-binding transcriptional regulator/antitoxin component of YhaV-PrlF toxin-antitoxin module
MKAVSIIRSRGQLTIPDNIRKAVTWANPMSAVSISVVKPNEIIIRPEQSYINWEEIWDGIKSTRAIRGSGKSTSAAEFLQEDRASH